MANSAFHKKQAEALVSQFNMKLDINDGYAQPYTMYLLELAKIHALLAQLEDTDEG